MFKIDITDNLSEKVLIGKRLVKLFDFDKVSEIKKTLDKVAPEDIGKITVDLNDLIYLTIYDYWVYGVNSTEELFYHFYEKTHEEKKKYLTFLNRWEYLYHIQDRQYADLLENKYEAYKLLMPYYKRDILKISGEDDYTDFLDFVEKHTTFVVKPVDLSLAYGVHKESIFDHKDKQAFFKELLNEGQMNKLSISTAKSSDILLEEIIDQSDEMSKFHEASANAVRITTVKVFGKVHVFYPWLKVGMNGDFATCANRGSVLAGIDAETGVINSNGKGEYLQEFAIHPNSGVVFKGFKIPDWQDLVDLVKEMALSLEQFNYVGWDMVHTKDKGWSVMEANWGGEFLGQLLQGKPLREEFETLIQYKSQREFWWKK